MAPAMALPPRAQRYPKWVGALAQVPVAQVSVPPTAAVPEIAGNAVFAGGTGGGTAADAESAGVLPKVFVAVTRHVSPWPASSSVTTYVAAVWPSMAAPSRSHANA